MSHDDFAEKVYNQLVLVNSRFDSLAADVKLLTREFKEREKITGELTIKVDRLDQDATRRAIWSKYAVGASVASIAGFIGTLFKFATHK